MGNDSSALEINKLDNFLFSKSDIQSAISKREHIFELQINGENLGYISLYDLKDYAASNVQVAEKIFIRNIDQNTFLNMYEHPLFQRRKPQIIVPLDEKMALQEQEFHILINGQKSGPFNKGQIENFLNKKEMIMNDMISLNAGLSWQKLYSAPGFERRALRPASELPSIPEEDYLKQGPADLRLNDEVINATSSLAYLGNLKKGKVQAQDFLQEEESPKIQRTSGNNGYKWLFLFSFIGVVYFLFNIKNALQSPLGETPQANLGEQAEKLNPVDPNLNSTQNMNRMNTSPRANDKFQQRQLPPVRPSNSRNQRSFRDANPNAFHETNEPTYYFDNAAPMELDPVREQVSKETFDTPPEPQVPPADDALFNQENSN